MIVNPLVSIIIPAYNRAHLIVESLNSVLAQTYTKWECIIVDDGSIDATVEVVKSFVDKDARFQLFHRPKDRLPGGNAARNYGFEQSKGDFIQWFDDDDVMLKDMIEFKVNQFEDQYNFVVTSGSIIDGNGSFVKDFRFNDKNHIYKQFALYESHIITNSVMFRKEFLVNKPLFDTTISRLQDVELFTRLFYQSSPKSYLILPHTSFLYRLHSENITSKSRENPVHYQKSVAIVYLKNLERSLTLRDKELVSYYYKKLINLLFTSLKLNQKSNYTYIFKELKGLIGKENKWLQYQLHIIFTICLLVKIPSYKLRKYLVSKSVL